MNMSRRALGIVFMCDALTVAQGQGQDFVLDHGGDDEDWARIDFRFRVVDSRESYSNKGEAERYGEEWVKEVFRVRGVERMDAEQYAVRVRKSRLGKWGEILPKVAEIVVRAKKG